MEVEAVVLEGEVGEEEEEEVEGEVSKLLSRSQVYVRQARGDASPLNDIFGQVSSWIRRNTVLPTIPGFRLS